MSRDPLLNRRAGQSFEIEHFDPLAGPGGMALRFHIAIGEYKDGRPGEVFVTALGAAGKGSMLEAFARDAAVLISLALQFGASVEKLRGAITRNEQNRPQTFVGAVLDAMEG